MLDKLNANDGISAGFIARNDAREAMEIHGRYHVECLGPDGSVKWTDDIDNLITTAGKNDLLTQYLKGSAYSAGTVFMGLKGTGTALAADTLASHASWNELNITSSPASGARATTTFGTASAGALATSAAVSFVMNNTATVAGVFLVTNGGSATNGNTSGILFSAGDFASSRSVVSGDTLNVTYTASV